MNVPKSIQNDVTILEAIGKGWDPDKFVLDSECPYALEGQLIADADCYIAALEGNDEHPQVTDSKIEALQDFRAQLQRKFGLST